MRRGDPGLVRRRPRRRLADVVELVMAFGGVRGRILDEAEKIATVRTRSSLQKNLAA
jgi:hypothetical protein